MFFKKYMFPMSLIYMYCFMSAGESPRSEDSLGGFLTSEELFKTFLSSPNAYDDLTRTDWWQEFQENQKTIRRIHDEYVPSDFQVEGHGLLENFYRYELPRVSPDSLRKYKGMVEDITNTKVGQYFRAFCVHHKILCCPETHVFVLKDKKLRRECIDPLWVESFSCRKGEELPDGTTAQFTGSFLPYNFFVTPEFYEALRTLFVKRDSQDTEVPYCPRVEGLTEASNDTFEVTRLSVRSMRALLESYIIRCGPQIEKIRKHEVEGVHFTAGDLQQLSDDACQEDEHKKGLMLALQLEKMIRMYMIAADFTSFMTWVGLKKWVSALFLQEAPGGYMQQIFRDYERNYEPALYRKLLLTKTATARMRDLSARTSRTLWYGGYFIVNTGTYPELCGCSRIDKNNELVYSWFGVRKYTGNNNFFVRHHLSGITPGFENCYDQYEKHQIAQERPCVIH